MWNVLSWLLDPCKKLREENVRMSGEIVKLLQSEKQKLTGLRQELESAHQHILFLAEEMMDVTKENTDLRANLISLNEFPDDSVKPSFLNTQTPYVPKRFYNGKFVQFPPTSYYSIPDLIKREVKEKGWAKLPHDEKLQTIWKFVTEKFRYYYDKEENWQDALTTWNRKGGDCEDTTILYIVLARAAGVRADSIFNACGQWAKLGGHSYPVVKREDGEWYVYESTSNTPSKNGPMLWEGSGYHGEYGLANWRFQGRLKEGDQV